MFIKVMNANLTCMLSAFNIFWPHAGKTRANQAENRAKRKMKRRMIATNKAKNPAYGGQGLL